MYHISSGPLRVSGHHWHKNRNPVSKALKMLAHGPRCAGNASLMPEDGRKLHRPTLRLVVDLFSNQSASMRVISPADTGNKLSFMARCRLVCGSREATAVGWITAGCMACGRLSAHSPTRLLRDQELRSANISLFLLTLSLSTISPDKPVGCMCSVTLPAGGPLSSSGRKQVICSWSHRLYSGVPLEWHTHNS